MTLNKPENAYYSFEFQQGNLFANHITLDNEYIRCTHKTQEITNYCEAKNKKTTTKFPEVGHFSDIPGCIHNIAKKTDTNPKGVKQQKRAQKRSTNSS